MYIACSIAITKDNVYDGTSRTNYGHDTHLFSGLWPLQYLLSYNIFHNLEWNILLYSYIYWTGFRSLIIKVSIIAAD